MQNSYIEKLQNEYREIQAQNLNLDMTRGKPSPEQLALSEELLTVKETRSDGIDCRNYGGLEGLPEARRLFAQYLGSVPEEIIMGGSSSLALMHDVIVQALLRGVSGKPWVDKGVTPTFLCPVPGYDRHFAICKTYGINMIPVSMNGEGPDMNTVKELVQDPSVVGMWCVPKYSNPTGITYSDKVVQHLASMKTANPGFRIFWDNAYAVHDLEDTPDILLNIREECIKNGNENRVFIFGSTSKITFAGAGITALAMSPANLEWFKSGLQIQTIGPDKINQLRHVLFLKDMENINTLMDRHKQILKPKVEAANKALEERLGGKGIATWTKPRGGYFINLEVEHGCAKKVIKLANEAGVKLTPAGATYPYGNDPNDSNIRIAFSFPNKEEITKAMSVVALCIEIASVMNQA